MSNHIIEAVNIEPVIAPVAQTAGGNTTGTYIPLPAYGSIDFVVRGGALAAGKKMTVEVYQASDTTGTGAAELTAYETVFTAPTGGSTDCVVTIPVNNADVTLGFATVKVSNDSGSAFPVDVFALTRKQYLD